jgi:hypothetical protein
MAMNEVKIQFSWAKKNNGMDRLKETLDELGEHYEKESKNKQDFMRRIANAYAQAGDNFLD